MEEEIVILGISVFLLIIMALLFAAWSYYYDEDIIYSSKYDQAAQIMTVEIGHRKGEFRKTVQYYGDGTVWFFYPSFKRCGTLLEHTLSGQYVKCLYELKNKNK